MTSLSEITGIDKTLLREKFELEPLQLDRNESENLVFMSPTVLLNDHELRRGGFLEMGAEKVLSLVTKDILESNDHTLFQVPEITCLHMGYSKKSDNKEGRMAISEKDAKTWFNILKLQSIPKQQDLDLHVPMEVTDVLPTASKTQGEERTDAMEVDSNTRRDNEGYIYNDTVQPCHDSGFLIPLKGSQILHMSILIINAIKKRSQWKKANSFETDYSVEGEELEGESTDNRTVEDLAAVAEEEESELTGRIGAKKISDFLSFWTLPYLLNYTQRKVEEIIRHHQAAGIKDPQSLVKTVKKSAWDIITQATQSKPEIQSKLQKTLDKYFTAEQLRVEYTLLKCDNSPVVLVPLPYVYTGKGDFLRIEDIGQKWESDRGEVLSREQFINSFVRKRDIQMDYFECMKDAKLRQGVDYAIIYPDKSAFELFLAEARHIDPNVLTSLKHVESQGRGMISPHHAVVKYNEGNLVVSFTYFQGTDRSSVAALFRAIGAHHCNHFTIVFLYGSTFSNDADCKLGSLYPVREAKELSFKQRKLQKVGKKMSFRKGISKFVRHDFPSSYHRWVQNVRSDHDVKVAMKSFSIEPTFDLSKRLKVAFAKSRQHASLRNACLQKEDKVRKSHLRMLSKYEIQAANLDGHLLSMIHQYGREDNIGVTLAINNTLQPEDPPTELMRAVNKNISYFVMAIIQAGLRKVFPSESDNEDRQTIESGSSSLSSSLSSSEVHDSDSNNMEVDAGPAEEPSSSGIVNVPSNLLASHEAPVERAVKAKEGIPKDNHELHRLANDVSALWRALGRELMVEEPRLDQIDTDFQQSSYEKAFQMLMYWRNSNADAATYQTLSNALTVICRSDLAQKYCT